MTSFTQDTSLLETVKTIFSMQMTGALKIQFGDNLDYISFKSGNVNQIASPNRASMLVEGINHYPNMDVATLKALEEKQKSTGDSILNIILLDKVNGRSFIEAICAYQIKEKFTEILNRPLPIFEFIEGELALPFFDKDLLQFSINTDTGALLDEAKQRAQVWQRIHSIFPSYHDVPAVNSSSNLALCSNEEKSLIPMINGVRDIEEIYNEISLSLYNILQILCNLSEKGYIKLKDGLELQMLTGLESIKNNTYKCIKLFERAEELGVSNEDTVHWLAQAYEILGISEKASKKYRNLGEVFLSRGAQSEASEAFNKAYEICPALYETMESADQIANYSEKEEHLETDQEESIPIASPDLETDQEESIPIASPDNEPHTEIGSMPIASSNNELHTDMEEEITTIFDGTPEDFSQDYKERDKDQVQVQEQNQDQEIIQKYDKLVQLHIHTGNYDEAINTYQKVISQYPDIVEFKFGLASILYALGKIQEALEYYKIGGAYIYDKKLFTNQSKNRLLLLASRRIIQNDPSNLKALIWQSDLYEAWNEKGKMSEVLDKIAVLIEPEENPEFYIQTLKKLITLKPDNIENWQVLAETYKKLNREKDAIDLYFNWGNNASEAEKTEEALNAFNEVLKLDPLYYPARNKRVEILIRQNKRDQTIAELKLLGYLHWSLGLREEAIGDFNRIISIDPQNELYAYMEMGKLYEELDEINMALNNFQKFAEKSALKGNLWDAITACERILNHAPGDVWATAAAKKVQNMLTESRRKPETIKPPTTPLPPTQQPLTPSKERDRQTKVNKRTDTPSPEASPEKPKSVLKEKTLQGLQSMLDKLAQSSESKTGSEEN